MDSGVNTGMNMGINTGTPPTPPRIFANARRILVRQRMRALQARADAARFMIDDMVDDVLERLAFLRHTPGSALVIGDFTGSLTTALRAQGTAIISADPAPGLDQMPIDEERPLRFDHGPVAPGPFEHGFDLVVSLGTLDTVNDLPGALIHVRGALKPGGLAIMAFPGAGGLRILRAIMLAADGDRPAPRLHPQIDVRAGGQLLQRAGFADPVVDSHRLQVSYASLSRLVGDIRAQGLSACLARGGGPLGKPALARAHQAFAAHAIQGRVTETFEILTLSGWARPIRPPKF